MGLLRMAARTAAVVGTAGAVQHHQQTKYAAQDAAGQPAQPQYAEPAAAAPAEEDPLLQIQKLGALKDQGLLTEEEFSAKKAQILGL